MPCSRAVRCPAGRGRSVVVDCLVDDRPPMVGSGRHLAVELAAKLGHVHVGRLVPGRDHRVGDALLQALLGVSGFPLADLLVCEPAANDSLLVDVAVALRSRFTSWMPRMSAHVWPV
jgi:hypothetical protein